MKKKILGIILFTMLTLSCTGCINTSYEMSKNTEIQEDYGSGYFTLLNEWEDLDCNTTYQIVYANDTKVKYLISFGYHVKTMTALYNADGTLQIYEGE